MATHPFVLLVEPDPLLRELIHGELKDHGCIVFDAANDTDALAFATVYPGSIDLALTDLQSTQRQDTAFASQLKSLPTGAQTRVIQIASARPVTPSSETTYLMKPFDRTMFLDAVKGALSKPPSRGSHKAVFWGANRETASAAVR